MARLAATLIKANRARLEHRLWARWMVKAAQLATRFYDEADGDDPFSYNETASVGFLAIAAGRAGYLALPEFAIDKKDAQDRRKRSWGRSDLWVQQESRSWSFEFKQHFITRPSIRDLARKHEAAVRCAHQLHSYPDNYRVAALVVSTCCLEDERRRESLASLEAFMTARQFAWKLGRRAGPLTFISFDVI